MYQYPSDQLSRYIIQLYKLNQGLRSEEKDFELFQNISSKSLDETILFLKENLDTKKFKQFILDLDNCNDLKEINIIIEQNLAIIPNGSYLLGKRLQKFVQNVFIEALKRQLK